jgi:phage gp46-like protein
MLALRWDNTVGAARLVKDPLGALVTDSSLESMVLISLFTDAEASQVEIKGAGLDRQQGWWADADSLRDPKHRRRGSKLWLLSRGKTTLETLRRCEGYIRDSLAWLIDAGIVATIAVATTRPRPGVVGIDLTLTRPSKLLPAYRRFWEVRHDAFL